MTLRGRPHQRGLILCRLFRVDVRPCPNEHPDSAGTACTGAGHQRRLPGRDRGVGVSTRLQQPIDERGTSVRARKRQGRHAQVVRHIGIRSGTKQQIGGLEIVPVRRPHERGRAVGRSSVDVDLLVQQRTDGTLITMSGRIDQPRIAVCRGHRRDNQQNRQGGGPSHAPVHPHR